MDGAVAYPGEDLSEKDHVKATLFRSSKPEASRPLKWFRREVLPTISAFYGILIQMFWQEHAPPHFHALYAEFEALIDIRTLEVIRDSFPRRALSLVMEWAAQHRNELMDDWRLCETRQSPYKIPPLE